MHVHGTSALREQIDAVKYLVQWHTRTTSGASPPGATSCSSCWIGWPARLAGAVAGRETAELRLGAGDAGLLHSRRARDLHFASVGGDLGLRLRYQATSLAPRSPPPRAGSIHTPQARGIEVHAEFEEG